MKHAPMAAWHIGVIGGSILYEAGALEEAQQIEVRSAFGVPSAAVVTGRLEGVRFTFMPRQGTDLTLSPSAVNYRANIDVMKRCGVTDILSFSAIGSLSEEMAPGDFVIVDQFIDHTVGRERSFFGDGVVAHVELSDPVCPRLAAFAGDAAEAAEVRVHRGGCYVAIEGPQFATRAESRMYRQWGADVIGMTAMPEARLCREAELPYALLAKVTDYDTGQANSENAQQAREILVHFARQLPEGREASPIDRALDSAFAVPPAKWDRSLTARLDAVAGRFMNG